MKKILLCGLVCCLLLCGCGKDKKEEKPVNPNLGKPAFELHMEETEGVLESYVTMFDDNGEFLYLELVRKGTASEDVCEWLNDNRNSIKDLTYTGVTAECVYNSDNSFVYTQKVTKDAVKDGYIDEDDYRLGDLRYYYDLTYTKSRATKFYIDQMDEMKEKGLECSDTNYIIVDGESKCW